jgi:hypothetical protein
MAAMGARSARGILFCLLGTMVLLGTLVTATLLGPPAVLAQAPTKELELRLEVLREEIARQGLSFEVAYSPAMDYAIEEICGLREPPDWRQKALILEPTPLKALPTRFDWRDLNGTTPVRNQGGCGSCWAFATVGVLESLVQIQEGTTEDLSEQYLVSCNNDGWDCGGGWFAHDYHGWDYVAGETGPGAVREASFPYQARDLPCNPPHPHPYRIESWATLSWGVPPVESIKQAIYQHGPVAAAVAVGSGFQAYRSGIFDLDESSRGINHAIVLVGWDDNYCADGKCAGVWILRNSWGSGWGVGGYMYIKYGTSQVGYAANYVVFQATPSAKVAPSEGTVGSRVRVTGSGFGDAKPKLYLEYFNAAKGTTVKRFFTPLEWSPTSILAAWQAKLGAGTYGMHLQPTSPEGAAPLDLGPFTIASPIIAEVLPAAGTAGDVITVLGRYFSTAKKTLSLQNPVTLKAKKIKGGTWFMDPETGDSSVQFVVPARPPGQYNLTIRNRVGTASIPFTVQ